MIQTFFVREVGRGRGVLERSVFNNCLELGAPCTRGPLGPPALGDPWTLFTVLTLLLRRWM